MSRKKLRKYNRAAERAMCDQHAHSEGRMSELAQSTMEFFDFEPSPTLDDIRTGWVLNTLSRLGITSATDRLMDWYW